MSGEWEVGIDVRLREFTVDTDATGAPSRHRTIATNSHLFGDLEDGTGVSDLIEEGPSTVATSQSIHFDVDTTRSFDAESDDPDFPRFRVLWVCAAMPPGASVDLEAVPLEQLDVVEHEDVLVGMDRAGTIRVRCIVLEDYYDTYATFDEHDELVTDGFDDTADFFDSLDILDEVEFAFDFSASEADLVADAELFLDPDSGRFLSSRDAVGDALRLHDEYVRAVEDLEQFERTHASLLSLWQLVAGVLDQSTDDDWPDGLPSTAELYELLTVHHRHDLLDDHEWIVRTANKEWGSLLLEEGGIPAFEEGQLASLVAAVFDGGGRSDVDGAVREKATFSLFYKVAFNYAYYQLVAEARAYSLVWLLSSSIRRDGPDGGYLLSGEEYADSSHRLGLEGSGGMGFYGEFVTLPYEEQLVVTAELTTALSETAVGRRYLLELAYPGDTTSTESLGSTAMNAVHFFDPDELPTPSGFDDRWSEEVTTESGSRVRVADRQLINHPGPGTFTDAGRFDESGRILNQSLVTLAQNLIPGIVELFEAETGAGNGDGSVDLPWESTAVDQVDSYESLVSYELWAILSTFYADADADADAALAEIQAEGANLDAIDTAFGDLSSVHGIVDGMQSDWGGATLDASGLAADTLDDLDLDIEGIDTFLFDVELALFAAEVVKKTTEIDWESDPGELAKEVAELVELLANVGLVKQIHEHTLAGPDGLKDAAKGRYFAAGSAVFAASMVYDAISLYRRAADGESVWEAQLGMIAGSMGMMSNAASRGATGAGSSALSAAGWSRMALLTNWVGWLITAGLVAWTVYQAATAESPLDDWIAHTSLNGMGGAPVMGLENRHEPVEDESPRAPDSRFFLYDGDEVEDRYRWQQSGFFYLQYPFGQKDEVTAVLRESNADAYDNDDPDTEVSGVIEIPDIEGCQEGSIIVLQAVDRIDGEDEDPSYEPGDVVHVIDLFEAYGGTDDDNLSPDGTTILPPWDYPRSSSLEANEDATSSLVPPEAVYEPSGSPDLSFKQLWTDDRYDGTKPTDVTYTDAEVDSLELRFGVGDADDVDAIFGFDADDSEATEYLLCYHLQPDLFGDLLDGDADSADADSAEDGPDLYKLAQLPRVGVEIDVQL